MVHSRSGGRRSRTPTLFDKMYPRLTQLPVVVGGVQAPRYRDSPKAISCRIGEDFANLAAAHEEEIRSIELMWEDHIRDTELMWRDRLEITVSELSSRDTESKITELERELERIREENKSQKEQLDKAQEDNRAQKEQLDKVQGLWGAVVDQVASQISSMSSGQEMKEIECSVCFATTSTAAISGHGLQVFYCQMGCPNIMCEGCMAENAFDRRCLYCRKATLQGPCRKQAEPTQPHYSFMGGHLPPLSWTHANPHYHSDITPPYSPTSLDYSPASPAYSPHTATHVMTSSED